MKRFLAVFLAATLVLTLSAVTAFAAVESHDNDGCILKKVTLKLDGSSYVSEGEATVRLIPNAGKFSFDAKAVIEHERGCDQLEAGSSEVYVYYKINDGAFTKLDTGVNPRGRSDISFSDISVPKKSGKLSAGDVVTLDFRYTNEGIEPDTSYGRVCTFYIYIGDADGEPILYDSSVTAPSGQTYSGTASSAAGSGSPAVEENPNTGLTFFAGAPVILSAAALALIPRRRQHKN